MKRELTPLVVALEVAAVFALGVMGNKIAEILKIEPLTLLLATVALLVAVMITTALRTNSGQDISSQATDAERSRAWSMPSTIAGMIPIGMALGLMVASVVGLTVGQSESYVGGIPLFLNFGIGTDDVVISAIGVASAFLFATFHKPALSAGIAIGFGLGAPPALLLTAHQGHLIQHTIVGYFLEFLLVAVLFTKLSAAFISLNALLTTRRT